MLVEGVRKLPCLLGAATTGSLISSLLSELLRVASLYENWKSSSLKPGEGGCEFGVNCEPQCCDFSGVAGVSRCFGPTS